jgi:hypothetical protein
MSLRKTKSNPFSALNTSQSCNSNITNEFRHNDVKHIEWIIEETLKELKEKPKKEMYMGDFRFQQFLRNIDLPKTICRKEKNHYILSTHGGLSGYTVGRTREFTIPENVYLISFDHNGLFPINNKIEYLKLRMGIQNRLQNSFLEKITEEIIKDEIRKLLLKGIQKEKLYPSLLNHQTIKYFITKNFRTFGPGEIFKNYNLTSEENSKFVSGLFKLPIQPILVSKESENQNWTISMNDETFKNDIIYLNEENIGNIQFLIHPTFKNNILIQKNEYYTFHQNYLGEIKRIESLSDKMRNMHSFEELGVTVKTSTNSTHTKKIHLKDLIEKLVQIKQPSSEDPIVIFCAFCTKTPDSHNYPQNNILYTIPNEIPTFNHNNNNIQGQFNRIRQNFQSNVMIPNSNITNYQILQNYNLFDPNLANRGYNNRNELGKWGDEFVYWGNEENHRIQKLYGNQELWISNQIIMARLIKEKIIPIIQRVITNGDFSIQNLNSNMNKLIKNGNFIDLNNMNNENYKTNFKNIISVQQKLRETKEKFVFIEESFISFIRQQINEHKNLNDFFISLFTMIRNEIFQPLNYLDLRKFFVMCNFQNHYIREHGFDNIYLDFYIPSYDFIICIFIMYYVYIKSKKTDNAFGEFSQLFGLDNHNFDEIIRNYGETKLSKKIYLNYQFNELLGPLNFNEGYSTEENAGEERSQTTFHQENSKEGNNERFPNFATLLSKKGFFTHKYNERSQTPNYSTFTSQKNKYKNMKKFNEVQRNASSNERTLPRRSRR